VSEIRFKLVDGEPVCNSECPLFGANDHCMSRSPGCYLHKVHPCYATPCIPGLRQQRAALKTEIERLCTAARSLAIGVFQSGTWDEMTRSEVHEVLTGFGFLPGEIFKDAAEGKGDKI